MKILGIETSCDETGISIIEIKLNEGRQIPLSFKLLSNQIHSQVSLHKEYGGVFPMMAKREHAKNIVPLLGIALKEAGIIETAYTNSANSFSVKSCDPTQISEFLQQRVKEILKKEPELYEILIKDLEDGEIPDVSPFDMIAVTEGPGLEPALWVGINFAKALAEIWDIPVIPVNHMEGHIVASLISANEQDEYAELKKISLPALSLLISGGHTEIILIENLGQYKIIGSTRDDAVGEAFDKVARLLDLPYPGGPEISKLAEMARLERDGRIENTSFKLPKPLPRPMITSPDFDFSFSGIKTAVLYTMKDLVKDNPDTAVSLDVKKAMALEFENAVTEVLIHKTLKAINEYAIKDLIIGGGVIASTHIKREFTKVCESEGINLHLPFSGLSGDNALMIAIAGAIKAWKNPEIFEASAGDNSNTIRAKGNLSLEEQKIN